MSIKIFWENYLNFTTLLACCYAGIENLLPSRRHCESKFINVCEVMPLGKCGTITEKLQNFQAATLNIMSKLS